MKIKEIYKLTGTFYLLIIICGLFSEVYVRMGLVIPGDAAQTSVNIQNSELLFRLGFLSDLIMVIADIIVAVLFYYLLKPVSEILAMLATFFRFGQAAIIGMNLLNLLSPLLLLSTLTQGAWSTEQINDQILFYMDSHKHGYLISQLFFAFNCGVMSFLLIKSSLFPKILGYGVGLASLSYLIDALLNFLVPHISGSIAFLMAVPVMAEFSLCFWLLIKGFKPAEIKN